MSEKQWCDCPHWHKLEQQYSELSRKYGEQRDDYEQLRAENEKLRVALGFIMAKSIPQGMSASLFAEKVLEQTGPDDGSESESEHAK